MNQKSVSQRLRADTDRIWEAIMAHPFVRGMEAGDLAKDKLVFYLKQDFYYVVEFGRVFGLAAVKSAGFTDMAQFAELMHVILHVELAMHRSTCAEFGVTEEDLNAVQPSYANAAYTDFIVRTCYEGDLEDILAVLLP